MKKPKTDTDRFQEPATGFVMIRRDALRELLTRPEVKDRHRRIILALCLYADSDTLECFPSVDVIATASGVRKNDVSMFTGEMQALGYLTVKRRQQRSNLYTVKILFPANSGNQEFPISRKRRVLIPAESGNLSMNENQEQEGARKRKPKEKRDRRITELARHFKDLHNSHRGTPYVPQYGADGKALKNTLATLSAVDIADRMSLYFARRDKWNEANGYTIRNFCSVINGIQTATPAKLSAFQISELEAAQKRGEA